MHFLLYLLFAFTVDRGMGMDPNGLFTVSDPPTTTGGGTNAADPPDGGGGTAPIDPPDNQGGGN